MQEGETGKWVISSVIFIQRYPLDGGNFVHQKRKKMKPYIISHMMESVDGRIDCDMTEQIDPSDSYYDALERLTCPSVLMGRITMQMHYAESKPFTAAPDSPSLGKTATHRAKAAEGYTIAIDSHGKLRWPAAEFDGKPLLVITAENCPKEYLDYLTGKGISWIAVGEKQIDLAKAMDILNREFGVERLAVVGGGHINGAFLAAGLLDEISVMIGPGIDGRKGMTAIFDGIDEPQRPATLLNLESVEKVNEGTVWLRYTVKQ